MFWSAYGNASPLWKTDWRIPSLPVSEADSTQVAKLSTASSGLSEATAAGQGIRELDRSDARPSLLLDGLADGISVGASVCDTEEFLPQGERRIAGEAAEDFLYRLVAAETTGFADRAVQACAPMLRSLQGFRTGQLESPFCVGPSARITIVTQSKYVSGFQKQVGYIDKTASAVEAQGYSVTVPLMGALVIRVIITLFIHRVQVTVLSIAIFSHCTANRRCTTT
ncbi:hypothetical protein MFIFM68171_02285 [Madurella fahalii]|uniref:Uncharacterized protein n=1 Tax=Madurella fahalii TaxID=1157608 RepID=A0ABQ0G3E1_9PEZI